MISIISYPNQPHVISPPQSATIHMISTPQSAPTRRTPIRTLHQLRTRESDPDPGLLFESNPYQDFAHVPASLRIGFEKISALGDKYWIPNVPNSKRTINGMQFDSLGDAWNFYEEYAIVGGFEPIKSTQNVI